MASPPPPPFIPSPDPRSQRRAARDQARLRAIAQDSSSILGPVVLVALGVAFLLVELGHLSPITLLSLASRWAPLLLVILGGLRLVEWFIDRRRLEQARQTGIPARPTRLSSGFGLLLFVLVVLSFAGRLPLHDRTRQMSSGLFSEQQQNWDQLFGQRHEHDTTFAQPCPPGTVLSLNLGHGDLTVTGTSSDGQFHASVHTSVFSASDSDASRKADALKPVIRSEGNQLSVSVPYAEGSQVDLTVTIPASIAVDARSDHGDITLSGLTAPISVIANHGDIQLNDVQADTAIRVNNSSSGLSEHQVRGNSSISGRAQDVTISDLAGSLQLDGEIFGDLHLERIQGPVRLHTSRIDLQFAALQGTLETEGSGDLTADQLTGPIVINTRNRNVSLDRVLGALTVNDQNGSVTASLLSPLSPIDISNRSGEITLGLPDSASFSVTADTTDADLTNSFGLSPTHDGNHVQLQASVGTGSPTIRLHSTQADIAINRIPNSSSAPPPPAPPHPPESSVTPHQSRSHPVTGGEVSF